MIEPTSVAADLTERVGGIRYLDLSEGVRRCAQQRIADTLSCMRAGVAEDSTSIVRDFAAAWAASGGSSTVVGSGYRLPAAWAAFVNATAAHALELDDAHDQSSVQPGSAIVAAVLAVAEECGASGRAALEAVIAGYEVALALGCWMAPEHKRNGFHPSSTLTTIGAAAAICRLRQLDRATTFAALTSATSFASGLLEFTRSPCNVNQIHLGRAAFSGIMTADLACRGISGPDAAFEGQWGLAPATTGGFPFRPWPGLSDRYLITDVATKPYPSCRLTHGPIDAAIAAYTQAGVRGRIDNIELLVSRQCIAQTDQPVPATLRERQFSTQFGVATGILSGRATLQQYRDPGASVAELATKVHLAVAPAQSNDRAAELRSSWSDGTTVRTVVTAPSGEPWQTDADPYDLIRRRDSVAGPFLDDLFDLVARLPGERSVSALAGWLREAH